MRRSEVNGLRGGCGLLLATLADGNAGGATLKRLRAISAVHIGDGGQLNPAENNNKYITCIFFIPYLHTSKNIN